ncbi:ATP-dependent DNA helicase RecG [Roseomonas marmotae]|uniref:ATP-dependent DNA helicase RecG n=1 Tax=Roseomonas marmotae TaxID=2768161 RepID=A0ABS3KF73_9PROT|nr:ATP-dependent DNA helicase RecG [Roseomonas marmotae]MBO1075303.1 ATP-dependent DNA helicase RecG [Roseomonas marmotae]QTI78283.1 ATP-dependent DNA helicase RecG [Roseomonas marmotae]
MGIVSAQVAEQDRNFVLFAPLSSLPLPEEKVKRLAQAVEGERLLDLLFHLPERYQDRRSAQAREGEVATLPVRIHRVCAPRGLSQPWVVQCDSRAGALDLIYFGRQRWLGPWLERHYPEGSERRVSGKLKLFRDRWQMDAPDYVSPPDTIPEVQPVWPLVKGLGQKDVAKGMAAALEQLPGLPEWHDAPLLARRRWPSFDLALQLLQAPAELPEEAPGDRLAYDELLAGQLAIGLVRRTVMRRPGRRLLGDGHLRRPALAAFGFPPTEAQVKAVAEIDADLAAPTRMLRLLQGDVGSGKTLVALLAMLRAVEGGAQAAIMAPTELLARQHLRTFQRLAGAAGVECVLLAGSVKGKERKRVLAGLADGSIPLVIGTHALIEDGVVFRDLGLVVVDEQHRFGVAQRLALTEKGTTDVLVMTATPIPRTLLLTQWGEMATSRLSGRPAGRQPIVTRIISRDRRGELTTRLRAAFAAGHRAYWVVRAVEEGERHDNVAAETTYAELAAIFGDKVRLAHGAQKLEVREAALQDFAAGRAQLLVATTVVEVGVDVPEATIMIIEQAERFGLAALHQLRGRVGRGSAQSFCLLLPSAELNDSEQRRLSVLRDTEDGFVIADADLEFRGGGDALGMRQAGHIGRRLVDPQRHAGLIRMAHKDAELLLQKDPTLSATPRGRAARLLLSIFSHDLTLAPLAAG